LKFVARMNYAQYMRKVAANQQRIIPFQNGQDASMVTLKAQAKVMTRVVPQPVPTQFSQVGGTIANIMEQNQQTNSPTSQVCSSGYQGTAGGLSQTGGFPIADRSGGLLLKAQGCAVCSDVPSSEPRAIVIPCCGFIDPVYNAPGQEKCCLKPGIKFSDKEPYWNQKALEADLRNSYNLPHKLQGLRGAVVRHTPI
jgi:hypothetical protein